MYNRLDLISIIGIENTNLLQIYQQIATIGQIDTPLFDRNLNTWRVVYTGLKDNISPVLQTVEVIKLLAQEPDHLVAVKDSSILMPTDMFNTLKAQISNANIDVTGYDVYISNTPWVSVQAETVFNIMQNPQGTSSMIYFKKKN